jgi:hypothetical protein
LQAAEPAAQSFNDARETTKRIRRERPAPQPPAAPRRASLWMPSIPPLAASHRRSVPPPPPAASRRSPERHLRLSEPPPASPRQFAVEPPPAASLRSPERHLRLSEPPPAPPRQFAVEPPPAASERHLRLFEPPPRAAARHKPMSAEQISNAALETFWRDTEQSALRAQRTRMFSLIASAVLLCLTLMILFGQDLLPGAFRQSHFDARVAQVVKLVEHLVP